MNQKIYKLLYDELNLAFSLPKYKEVVEKINTSTVLLELPWTPARLQKFENHIKEQLILSNIDLSGTLEQVCKNLDQRYLMRFFGEIWKPNTEKYQYTGWSIVEEINKQNPKSVLDFGCGFNQFKGRVSNLIGIDPYNNCADYMVDVLDFKVENESFDHIIAFGSLNFNSRDEIDLRFRKLVELLMPMGKIYFRANPGISWPNGPYVDIFPWDFETVYELSKKYNLNLISFKKDSNNRFFFILQKKERALDQGLLNDYFANKWSPIYGECPDYTHRELATQIGDDEWVLDVGCGYNPFKNLCKNVIGIDPAFDQADVITTIENYEPDRLFDVAICFGSINFGSDDDIRNQIKKVVSCLKDTGRIYWRVNPGYKDHQHEGCKAIDFYPWTMEKLQEFSSEFGFKQINFKKESVGVTERLHAEWIR